MRLPIFKVLQLVIPIALFFMSCSSREVRETKNAATGNPQEKYEVKEVNGSFLRDGFYKSWYDNGQLKDEGQYKENKKVGEWKTFYENGQLFLQANYTEDKPNGKYVSWYDNGTKSEEGEFKNGQKTATCISWYPNGQKKLEQVFSGLNEKQTAWYQTGQKRLEGSLKSGVKEGVWNLWTIDGELTRIFKYQNGRDMAIVGKWVSIDPDGKQHTFEFFPNGTFVGTHPDHKERSNYKLHEETIYVGGTDYQIVKLTDTDYEMRTLNFSQGEPLRAKRTK